MPVPSRTLPETLDRLAILRRHAIDSPHLAAVTDRALRAAQTAAESLGVRGPQPAISRLPDGGLRLAWDSPAVEVAIHPLAALATLFSLDLDAEEAILGASPWALGERIAERVRALLSASDGG